MSTSQKDLPKIRTFAQDLEERRADQKNNKKPDQPTDVAKAAENDKTIKVSDDKVITNITDNKTKDAKDSKTKAADTDKSAEAAVIKENPPFHSITKNSELSKKLSAEIETITKRESEKKPESILSGKKTSNISLQEEEDDITANIITDTKRNRFKLGSAIVSGLSSWWSAQKAEQLKKKQPKYIVEQAELRKGVIQEATSITAKASTSDHKAVIDRIRNKQKQEKLDKKEVVNETKEVKKEPAWEKVAETPLPKLVVAEQVVGKSTSNVSIAPKLSVNTDKKEIPQVESTPTTLKPTTPVVKKPQAVNLYQVPKTQEQTNEPEKAPVAIKVFVPPPTPKADNTVTANIPSAPTTENDTAVVPPPPTKINEEVDREAEVEVENTPSLTTTEPTSRVVSVPVRSRRDENRGISLRSTNTLTMGVASIIVLVVIGVVALTVIKDRVIQTSSQPEVVAYFNDQTLTKQALTEVSRETVQLALAQSTETSGLTEIALVDTVTGREYTAATILNIFNNAPSSIISNINSVRFGRINGDRFILLNITNKNAALGGMLLWEDSLERDLYDFITTTNVGTTTEYIDRTVNSKDVRSLSGAGVESITYGFIDNNHIIITGDISAFASIVEQNH